MDIKNTLKTYKKTKSVSLNFGEKDLIVSNSDWDKDFVLLTVGDTTVMVKSKELQAAINNATNTG